MSDERHLWPVWFKLIRQCQPDVVFGEQVEAAIRHGWLDLVQADMEGIGYAFAPVGIPAAGFGAPHIRQRLWFVAEDHLLTDRSSQRVAFADEGRRGRRSSDGGGVSDRQAAGWDQDASDAAGCSSVQQLAHPTPGGLGINGHGDGDSGQVEAGSVAAAGAVERPGPTNGHWRDADWIFCRDGKWRPVESGTFPLAHGAPSRVGRLRAYGNAIVAEVAAEVIGAYLEAA